MLNKSFVAIVKISVCVLVSLTSAVVSFGETKQLAKLTIKHDSSFVNALDVEKYKELDSPKYAMLFRWDFSENKEYSYKYNQQVVSANYMSSIGINGKGRVSTQNTTGIGKLSYRSEKGREARFILEDLILTTDFSPNGAKGKYEKMKVKSPPLIVQGVKEDGNLVIKSSLQTLLLKLLFPLPSKPIKVSGTENVKVNMPFDAMGSLLVVKGETKITLEKFVEINGSKCAKFSSIINITKLNIPPEVKGKYVARAKGKSVFYFDVDNRKFVSGNLALLMTMDIEADLPQADFSVDKKHLEKTPKKLRMLMNNDNLISLHLIEN